MPKTELERRFAKAVWLIRNGPPKAGTSNDEKLLFYGYFKQATEGDCSAPQPWAGAHAAAVLAPQRAAIAQIEGRCSDQTEFPIASRPPPWPPPLPPGQRATPTASRSAI